MAIYKPQVESIGIKKEGRDTAIKLRQLLA